MKHTIKTLLVAGAMGLTTVSATLPVTAADTQSWQKAVIKKVQKSFIYPRSALRQELEGRAEVKLTFDKSGAITNFEVLTSSGVDALDKVIPKMVERLDPLPEPPADMAQTSLTIPFSWRLQ